MRDARGWPRLVALYQLHNEADFLALIAGHRRLADAGRGHIDGNGRLCVAASAAATTAAVLGGHQGVGGRGPEGSDRFEVSSLGQPVTECALRRDEPQLLLRQVPRRQEYSAGQGPARAALRGEAPASRLISSAVYSKLAVVGHSGTCPPSHNRRISLLQSADWRRDTREVAKPPPRAPVIDQQESQFAATQQIRTKLAGRSSHLDARLSSSQTRNSPSGRCPSR